jgi:hypothetical protein
MIKRALKSAFLTLLLAASASAAAIDLWRHPEIADKNSLFADIGFAPLDFENFDFPFLPLDIRVDYFPPLPLPVSFGLFLKTPNPNLKSFGARLAWHIDLDDPSTDPYLAYAFDFGFLRNDVYAQYNDSPVPAYYYDFRVGIRRLFGGTAGVSVESDFKFTGLIFMLSIKIF